jgi:hypothetical protein
MFKLMNQSYYFDELQLLFDASVFKFGGSTLFDESQLIILMFKFDASHLSNIFECLATRLNQRYNMVFVPFCGVDNHRRCVTFASGLLSKEDIPHYTWVFRAFMNAMEREPLCILTDQCPAMKQAVPAVFTKTRHRLCMWHIMKKLSIKVV